MANDDITINLGTVYDGAGIKKAKEDIKQAGQEAQKASESFDSVSESAADASQTVVLYVDAMDDSVEATQKDTKAKEANKSATEKQGKEIDATAKKIEASGKKAQQAGENLGEGAQEAGEGLKISGYGMLQVAQFADDAQYGLRGVMNNIPGLVMGLGGGMGLAGALSVAVLGFAKLYDWLGKSFQRTEELKKKQAEQATEFRRQMSEADRLIRENEASRRAEEMQTKYSDYVKGITDQFRDQTAELDKQIRMREQAAAREAGIDTTEAELALLNLKNRLDSGNISEEEYNTQKFIIDTNLQRKLHGRKIDVANQNYVAQADKTAEAELHVKGLTDQQAQLQTLADLLPEADLLRESVETIKRKNNYIGQLNKELKDAEVKIKDAEYNLKHNTGNTPKFWKSLIESRTKERDAILKKRAGAIGERDAANDQINQVTSLFEQADITFVPFNEKGDLSVSVKEYLTKSAELKKKIKDLNEPIRAAQKTLDDAQEDLMDAEANVWHLQDQEDLLLKKQQAQKEALAIRNAKASAKREQDQARQEEQVKTEARQKLAQQLVTAQGSAITANGLHIPIDPRTGRRYNDANANAADRAYGLASNVIAAGLKNDGQVDKSELSKALSEAENSLKEQGVDNQKILNFLSSQLIDFAVRLNNLKAEQDAALQKAIDQKNRELAREKNRWKNYVR